MDYQVFFTTKTPWSMYGGGFIELTKGETFDNEALAHYGKDTPRSIRLEVSNLSIARGFDDEGKPSGMLSGSGSTKARFNDWHDGSDYHCDRFSVLGSQLKTTQIPVTVRCGIDKHFEGNETGGLGVSIGAVRFDNSEDSLRGYVEGPHIWCEIFVSPESFNQMCTLIIDQKDLNPLLVVNFSTPEDVYLSWDPLGGMPREIKILASRRDIVNAEDIPDDFFTGDEFGFDKSFQPLNSWSVIATLPQMQSRDVSAIEDADLDETPEGSMHQIERMSVELAQSQMALMQLKQQVSLLAQKGIIGGVLLTMIAVAVAVII